MQPYLKKHLELDFLPYCAFEYMLFFPSNLHVPPEDFNFKV